MRAFFANHPWGQFVTWGGARAAFYLHLSLFTFFIGCLIYLYNIHHAVFVAVAWWVCFYTFIYTGITLLAVTTPEELLFTPFSGLALWLYLRISHVFLGAFSYIKPLRVLSEDADKHHRVLRDRYRDGFLPGAWKAAEEIALKPSPEIDGLILERVFLALDDDPALEKFFDAIPGFCSSKLVTVPFPPPVQTKFQQALDGFLDRTFSSDSISESVRSSRLIICLNAARAAIGTGGSSQILDEVFNGRWGDALQSVEFGTFLRRWGNNKDESIGFKIRKVVACIIARTRERDNRWTMLVKDEFGVPDAVFRDYLTHGDNVLLAILIHATRQAFRNRLQEGDVLRSLSGFDIRGTLPGLQHDFCALWNEIVQDAGNNVADDGTPINILVQIRHLYVALHEGSGTVPTRVPTPTDGDKDAKFEPSLYPPCTIISHRPDSTIDAVTATKLGDSLNVNSRPSPVEYPATPGDGAASQGAEKRPIFVPTFPSPHFADNIGTVKIHEGDDTWGVNIPIPMDVSLHPTQFTPSSAADVHGDTNIMRPDDPTPHMHTSNTDVTPCPPAVPSLTFPQPDLVLVSTAPPTGLDLLPPSSVTHMVHPGQYPADRSPAS
ncbi:hypothetical protein BC827DRAFT_520043 [Russula dissimulans]|nr:hypothetical protein BC827DRAFT_520043 [Russula dissimulans]